MIQMTSATCTKCLKQVWMFARTKEEYNGFECFECLNTETNKIERLNETTT